MWVVDPLQPQAPNRAFLCREGKMPPWVVSVQKGCAALSRFSCVRLFGTLRTVACQAPPSMGFSRQENWSGLSSPSLGGLPNPGTELHW